MSVKLTQEKLKGEIEHKKICIALTEKVIKNPSSDIVLQIMTEQAIRLKEELSKLEKQLASILVPLEKKKVRKIKKKQVVRKQQKGKGVG